MKRSTGMTLIELLVALAVVGILAALSYPSYQRYAVRAKRLQAQAALFELMQQQERYFSIHNSYIAFSSSSSEPQAQRFKWWSGRTAADSAYELRGAACESLDIGSCIELTALPGTGEVDRRFQDAECGVLSLSSNGRRQASGSAPACWP
jgi:type IV pilus assembly protein PilE